MRIYKIIYSDSDARSDNPRKPLKILVRPPRFELGTPGLEGRCSIQLSYGRVSQVYRVCLELSASGTPLSPLGHNTDMTRRRDIVSLLTAEPRSVSSLARALGLTRADAE